MKRIPNKIVILGVGLIGGSIAMGLKKHFGDDISILGSCSDLKRAKAAKDLGILDIAISSQQNIPTDVKLIIITTPINITMRILKLLSKIPLPKCLIIDVGSTKENIINEAGKFPSISASFIGTHPMAGSELSGFENASVNLFRNKPWIVCSDNLPTDHKQLAIVKQIIKVLGAKMVLMDAKTHDELSSWASHLSLVTSSILVNTIAGHKNWNQIAKIASTGFRDTTRLASMDPGIKADILSTNKVNILASLDKLKTEIDKFAKILTADNELLFEYLNNAKKIRDNWLVNNFS